MVGMDHLKLVAITVQFARYDARFANGKLLSRPTAIPAKKCQGNVITVHICREYA
jgi:hypothetical protein